MLHISQQREPNRWARKSKLIKLFVGQVDLSDDEGDNPIEEDDIECVERIDEEEEVVLISSDSVQFSSDSEEEVNSTDGQNVTTYLKQGWKLGVRKDGFCSIVCHICKQDVFTSTPQCLFQHMTKVHVHPCNVNAVLECVYDALCDICLKKGDRCMLATYQVADHMRNQHKEETINNPTSILSLNSQDILPSTRTSTTTKLGTWDIRSAKKNNYKVVCPLCSHKKKPTLVNIDNLRKKHFKKVHKDVLDFELSCKGCGTKKVNTWMLEKHISCLQNTVHNVAPMTTERSTLARKRKANENICQVTPSLTQVPSKTVINPAKIANTSSSANHRSTASSPMKQTAIHTRSTPLTQECAKSYTESILRESNATPGSPACKPAHLATAPLTLVNKCKQVPWDLAPGGSTHLQCPECPNISHLTNLYTHMKNHHFEHLVPRSCAPCLKKNPPYTGLVDPHAIGRHFVHHVAEAAKHHVAEADRRSQTSAGTSSILHTASIDGDVIAKSPPSATTSSIKPMPWMLAPDSITDLQCPLWECPETPKLADVYNHLKSQHFMHFVPRSCAWCLKKEPPVTRVLLPHEIGRHFKYHVAELQASKHAGSYGNPLANLHPTHWKQIPGSIQNHRCLECSISLKFSETYQHYTRQHFTKSQDPKPCSECLKLVFPRDVQSHFSSSGCLNKQATTSTATIRILQAPVAISAPAMGPRPWATNLGLKLSPWRLVHGSGMLIQCPECPWTLPLTEISQHLNSMHASQTHVTRPCALCLQQVPPYERRIPVWEVKRHFQDHFINGHQNVSLPLPPLFPIAHTWSLLPGACIQCPECPIKMHLSHLHEHLTRHHPVKSQVHRYCSWGWCKKLVHPADMERHVKDHNQYAN